MKDYINKCWQKTPPLSTWIAWWELNTGVAIFNVLHSSLHFKYVRDLSLRERFKVSSISWVLIEIETTKIYDARDRHPPIAWIGTQFAKLKGLRVVTQIVKSIYLAPKVLDSISSSFIWLYKNLEDFNLTSLTKLNWKILTQPQTENFSKF